MLTTGRAGSVTFARAAAEMSNYSVGHETRASRISGRLNYHDQHVEVDNRLSHFLGLLGERYRDDDTVWVHLTRDPELVAQSYARRMRVQGGIMPAFAYGVIMRSPAKSTDALSTARLMVATVTANIDLFLASRDVTRIVTVDIDDPHAAFDRMWDMLGAEGDRQAAHTTLSQVHNRGRR